MYHRRHDPESSNVVNLLSLPQGSKPEDYDNWIVSPHDEELRLRKKFINYESTEEVLKLNYGVRTTTNDAGIFHKVKSEGLGSSEPVFELVQGLLYRPIPVKIE